MTVSGTTTSTLKQRTPRDDESGDGPLRDRSVKDAPRFVRCFECPLRERDAFKRLPDDRIAHIQRMKSAHIGVAAGADVVVPGQENVEVYTLFSGWAYRYKEAPDGRRQILNFLLPGDLVGLQAAMFEAPRHGISALTDIELCVLPRRQVWNLFGALPDLAFDVTWLGAREESQLDQNMLAVGRLNAAERVASLVITLFRRCRALGLTQDQSFLFPLNQQHISDALGLSLAHTNKTLALLRRRGMFAMNGSTMTLTNPRVLTRIAQAYDAEFSVRPLI